MAEPVRETVPQSMMRLFAGLMTTHGTHGVPYQEPDSLKWGIKRVARTIREPVTLKLWEEHLAGKEPLGVIPIREDSTCVWGSIDIDEYDINLLNIVEIISRRNLPLVPCRSKSGGLHLFAFLKTPIPAGIMIAVLRDLAASLGFAECEIFPKQSELLTERGDFGNWMIVPYFGSTYGGKIREQVGLRPTGAELTVEEFIRAADKVATDQETFTALVETNRRPPGRAVSFASAGGVDTSTNAALPFGDGPPCLQHMSQQGVPAGGRNSTLLMMGIYYKQADPEHWEDRLEEANRQYMSPPQSSDEVQSAIRSLRKKEYLYTCKTEPMRSHCNSRICRTRRFGVGSESDVPKISGMSRLNTEPVIWFVDVGDQRIEVNTDTLQNYIKFHAVCMERLTMCFQMVKQSDWMSVVAEVMRNATTIEAPPDISEAERFRELLEEFLTNRQRGQSREDLLRGVPWEDETDKRHYFQLKDFSKFLEREGMKNEKRGHITQRIKAMGGAHKGINVKGKFINTWWVPSSVVQATPEVSPKPVPGAPV